MAFDHDGCNTGLVLGLGFSTATINHYQQMPKRSSFLEATSIEPISLTLALPGEDDQASPPRSAVSSFSGGGRVKRERDLSSEEIEVEIERFVSSRASDHEDELDGVINARKKLRLTKEQSAFLEDSFKQHSTLNPKQKQALARQLNLRPRQVEVWFQNRRARTKLKQTEVDCEFLKKCCETLSDENRKLHKELQELKTLKLAQPIYMHMPAATLTMCPSCQRIGDGNSKAPFPMAPKSHCFSPLTNPSAAC